MSANKGVKMMFFDDRLDERKMKILRAIINDYIDTAEPIGSRTIARKHELGLSSATIRNEMADLEDMGYLDQPHTSSGRIPSDKGYRLYVDHLMKLSELTHEEIQSIKDALEIKINELSQLIRQTSVVMSNITKYTSIAISPQLRRSTLKAVQVVPIAKGKALVIVVVNAGVVRNMLVKIQDSITPDQLIRISNLLNEKLTGLNVEQINRSLIRDINKQMFIHNDTLMPILDGVAECIEQIDNAEIFLDGTTHIFNYPEFKDVEKARGFLNVLEKKKIVRELLNDISNNEINIHIGNENTIDEIKDCTLLTTTYNFGDMVVGSIGIIGPTRMDYSRVISAMNYIRKKMNIEINKLFGENVEDS